MKDLHHANIAIGILDLGEDWKQLSIEENKQELPVSFLTGISQKKGSPARIHSLAGRWLLNVMMQNAELLINEIPTIFITNNGRPIFQQSSSTDPLSDWHFSISHAERFVACILSHKFPVGLDIEKNNVFPYADCKMVFHEHEWKRITAASDNSEFYKWWTAKEALCKAEGLGLIENLNQLNLAGWSLKEDHYQLPAFPETGNSWHLYSQRYEDDYTLTMATTEKYDWNIVSKQRFKYDDCGFFQREPARCTGTYYQQYSVPC